jgi:transcriptional antiterminator NusG
VHTRTGYENKVKTDLEKTVENRHMQDRILEIKIPTEEVIETRRTAGKKPSSGSFSPATSWSR